MSKRLNSPEELKKLRESVQSATDVRGEPKELQVTIHMGTCGIAAGARDVLEQFSENLFESSIKNVTLRQTGCIGLCDQEPMITLTDKTGQTFLYGKLDASKVRQIVREHVIGGNPVSALLIPQAP
jgi:NADP-reducing hydrogenase subunit HndB